MELTGIFGDSISWLIIATAHIVVACGVACFWTYIMFDVILKRTMIWMGVYKVFIQFIFYRKRFLRFMKEKSEDVTKGISR